jgi:hypothetical protein
MGLPTLILPAAAGSTGQIWVSLCLTVSRAGLEVGVGEGLGVGVGVGMGVGMGPEVYKEEHHMIKHTVSNNQWRQEDYVFSLCVWPHCSTVLPHKSCAHQ